MASSVSRRRSGRPVFPWGVELAGQNVRQHLLYPTVAVETGWVSESINTTHETFLKGSHQLPEYLGRNVLNIRSC
jgi:hypothetical protein